MPTVFESGILSLTATITALLYVYINIHFLNIASSAIKKTAPLVAKLLCIYLEKTRCIITEKIQPPLDGAAKKITTFDFIAILIIYLSVGVSLTYSIQNSTDVLYIIMALSALGIIPTLYILIFMSKFNWIREIYKSGFIKYFVGIALASLAWIANGEVSSEINNLFGEDASNFHHALAAGIFIRVLGYLALPVTVGTLLVMIFIFIVAIIFMIIDYNKQKTNEPSNKKNYFSSLIITFFISLAFLGLTLSYTALSKVGLSNFSKFAIYRIAYEYDFNSSYFCQYDGSGKKMLFVGSDQKTGLPATAPTIKVAPLKLHQKELEKMYPVADKKHVSCNQPEMMRNETLRKEN